MKKQKQKTTKALVAANVARQFAAKATAQAGNPPAAAFAAAAYASGQKVMNPKVQTSNGSTRIVHRELLATINGSVSFSVGNSLVLNPGLATSFPWLSTQASGWEQYRFNRLCFRYITRSATTATGSVLLAPDYDSIDAPPASELAASTYRDAVEDAPWKDLTCVFDPKSMHALGPRKYLRSTAVVGSDLKTYDAGALHVCLTGQADTSAIGKLWVEYDVELFVPQTSSTSTPNPTQLAMFNLSASQSLTTAVEATVVYDETVTNSIGIVNTSGVFTLPLGNWEVHVDSGVDGGSSAAQSLLVEIQKDNAAMTIPCVQRVQDSGAAASENLAVHSHGFISSTGTTTCRVRVTYISAAGTLVAVLDRNRISFRVC